MRNNKIILGTVQMGLPYGIQGGGGMEYNEAEKILYKAYNAGIQYLDTAEVYGKAHKVIGNFHKSSNIRFKVITKLPKILGGRVDGKIDEYLKELEVEKLEALMFHSFEAFQENFKAVEELVELKNSGLVDQIGVSIYTNEQLEILIENEDIGLIQLPFNLLDNYSIRGELLKRAKNHGKIIHARSAFLQGLFFMNVDSENKVVQALRPQLLLLKAIAEKENRGMASLALNYALQQDCIDSVLIGVDSVKQFEENLIITGNPLSENVLEEINKISVREKKLLNPSLWN